jgi:hypothetical protein
MVFFEDCMLFFEDFNDVIEDFNVRALRSKKRKKREDYTSTSRPPIKSPKCSHGSKASSSVYLARC